ncbi:MAG: hypothetical protein R2825_15075 [Saprospiraceae bacterium]
MVVLLHIAAVGRRVVFYTCSALLRSASGAKRLMSELPVLMLMSMLGRVSSPALFRAAFYSRCFQAVQSTVGDGRFLPRLGLMSTPKRQFSIMVCFSWKRVSCTSWASLPAVATLLGAGG